MTYTYQVRPARAAVLTSAVSTRAWALPTPGPAGLDTPDVRLWTPKSMSSYQGVVVLIPGITLVKGESWAEQLARSAPAGIAVVTVSWPRKTDPLRAAATVDTARTLAALNASLRLWLPSNLVMVAHSAGSEFAVRWARPGDRIVLLNATADVAAARHVTVNVYDRGDMPLTLLKMLGRTPSGLQPVAGAENVDLTGKGHMSGPDAVIANYSGVDWLKTISLRRLIK